MASFLLPDTGPITIRSVPVTVIVVLVQCKRDHNPIIPIDVPLTIQLESPRNICHLDGDCLAFEMQNVPTPLKGGDHAALI